MPVRRLAMLALAVAVALAPLVSAGSQNDPETGDDMNDDVAVNGGINCGAPAVPPFGTTCVWPVSTDFEWPNTDIDWAWVNDTGPALLFTAQMKAGTAFEAGAELFGAGERSAFTHTYTFAFTVNGTPYQAIAIMGSDGVFTIGGVASEFAVHDGNRLTLVVPKAAVGAPANGVVVGALLFTAHGQDEKGNTLDDRAPDKDLASRDYAVANTTASDDQAAPANNTGNATAGSPGGALTGTSTGPTRPAPSGTAEHPSKGNGPSVNETTGEGKDTPGPALVLTLVAFVAVGVFVRRRV
ncbi:MAG TPA: hypothetical protein VM327_02700 [Candidatus Thermoplasmatota archaeon]|nr:hypothetical protein [Candidatus Thermoplasmatota archaeon]